MALIAQMFEGEAGGRPPDRRAELDRLRLLVDATGTAPARRAGADAAPGGEADDAIPVLPTLRPLLPGGVLRRGSVVAVEDRVRGAYAAGRWDAGGGGTAGGRDAGGWTPEGRDAAGRAATRRDAGGRTASDSQTGSGFAAPSYLALALAAGASAGGGWCGVVGLPALGIAAAAGLGADLRRMLLLDDPGDRWAEAVAVLAGAVDLILVRPPGRPTAEQLRRITARLRRTARQRGAALVVAGDWHGAHLTLRTTHATWTGLGAGQGHLTGRRVRVVAEGRGGLDAEGRPRTALLWLPAADGSVASAAGVPVGGHGGAEEVRHPETASGPFEDERGLAEVVRLRSA